MQIDKGDTEHRKLRNTIETQKHRLNHNSHQIAKMNEDTLTHKTEIKRLRTSTMHYRDRILELQELNVNVVAESMDVKQEMERFSMQLKQQSELQNQIRGMQQQMSVHGQQLLNKLSDNSPVMSPSESDVSNWGPIRGDEYMSGGGHIHANNPVASDKESDSNDLNTAVASVQEQDDGVEDERHLALGDGDGDADGDQLLSDDHKRKENSQVSQIPFDSNDAPSVNNVADQDHDEADTITEREPDQIIAEAADPPVIDSRKSSSGSGTQQIGAFGRQRSLNYSTIDDTESNSADYADDSEQIENVNVATTDVISATNGVNPESAELFKESL
jgi:hypothetical protein